MNRVAARLCESLRRFRPFPRFAENKQCKTSVFLSTVRRCDRSSAGISRSIRRPSSASCRRIQHAIAVHGAHSSYYLFNGLCEYHLTNDVNVGTLTFSFEGTLLTDSEDARTQFAQLHVELQSETCDWLSPAVIAWYRETVARAVKIEFDRYIASRDRSQTQMRLDAIELQCNTQGGFFAMGL